MLETQKKEKIADKVAEAVEKFPPMPASVIELRQAVADPDADYARLVPALKRDPGLCADLLAFANSAFYGINHRVGTVEEAVRYFGMKNLAEFVAASFSESAIRATFSQLEHLDRYFLHSREVSEVCRKLARRTGVNRQDQEMLALAGLLHDIGRLALALLSDRDTRGLLGARCGDMAQIVAEERADIGIDHCELGAAICHRWQFPGMLEEGVARHHTPLMKDDLNSPGAYIFLSHLISFPELPDALLATAFPDSALSALHLKAADLIAVRAECNGKGKKRK